ADLRGVVHWSYRLLTEQQQHLLASLSVFAGGFDLAAVTGLLARSGPGEEDGVVPALEELVESSLLERSEREGRVRYRMLALVRSYAHGRLEEHGAEDRVRLAHARWAADAAEEAAGGWLGGGAEHAHAVLLRTGADLAAAMRWALHSDRRDLAARIALAVKLCLHWLPGSEMSALIVEAAEEGAPSLQPTDAAGAAAGAMVCAERGEKERAEGFARIALKGASDPSVRALARLAAGVACFHYGTPAQVAGWMRPVTEDSGVVPGVRGDVLASL